MTERELSKIAATRRGIHDRLSQLDAGRAPNFDPGRTLRLRVEFTRQLKRRRTQVAFGLLIVLPVIIAFAFKVGGGAGADAPQLVTLATSGGYNFALFTEFAAVGFLLVVVVALFWVTPWPVRRVGRRCATCWPSRCRARGCCGRS